MPRLRLAFPDVQKEPLLLPAIALAAGVLTANLLSFQWTDLIPPGVLALFGLFLSTRHSARRFLPATISVGAILCGIGISLWQQRTPTPRLNVDDRETAWIEGCVTNPPVFSPDRSQFTVELARRAKMRLTLDAQPGEQIALAYGQRVAFPAKIRFPHNYQNPGGFDYVRYLSSQQIYWTANLKSAQEVKVLPGSCGSPFIAPLYRFRGWALARLEALYPGNPETAALLKATLLGETTGVERRWTNDFRVTGTYHALVISGQHVSVLAFCLLGMLRLLRLRRLPALCLATCVSWLYAFISGLSSPVIRAAGGFTLFLLASFCFRRTRVLNVLAAVGILYLIWDPNQLFDPSFQLSFLSAAAIAVFAIPAMERFTEPIRASITRLSQVSYDPHVEGRAAVWRVEWRLLSRTIRVWTRLPISACDWTVGKLALIWVFVCEAVLVSACVQFGLALPMIEYFHRLSLTGLTANIAVVPLLSLAVPLGFVSIATGWHFPAVLTQLLLDWSSRIASWHATLEPSWRIASLPAAVAVAFAAMLIWLALAIRAKRWIVPALVCSVAAFGLICWQPWPAIGTPQTLEVTAIDVGQGDSLLLLFPNGERMLVDAGGFPGFSRLARKPQLDIGEDVISPYLWSRRIQRLDYAVLTHGHFDHMGGLGAILDNFKPRELWIGPEPQTADWRALEQRAARDGVKLRTLHREDAPIPIGGAVVRVLAPASDYQPADGAQNDDSLVLEIKYGRRSVLLTGDAEASVEAELAGQGLLQPVTLLKVGHHGSKTSSSAEFLDSVHPAFAFISDGYKNQFHHPHPTVLARLADRHVDVLRTDLQGLLTFRTDGETVEIGSFR